MELRQLEAFVTLAEELHFGRAADRLHIGAPTLSELIRRLETELGAALFTRTTRRVALTAAGSVLLTRSRGILEDVAAATAAVRRVANGDGGSVRLGLTPPAAPVLAPFLVGRMAVEAPQVTVDLRRMWLPALSDALAAGAIDVALTCGVLPARPGLATAVVGAEELLVGLRETHPLAAQESIALADLEGEVVGVPPKSLFPAWAVCVDEALALAGVAPTTAELSATELGGGPWTVEAQVGWVVLIGSLLPERPPDGAVVRTVRPRVPVPFSLQWSPERAGTTAVARFVELALTGELPGGWFRPDDRAS